MAISDNDYRYLAKCKHTYPDGRVCNKTIGDWALSLPAEKRRCFDHSKPKLESVMKKWATK